MIVRFIVNRESREITTKDWRSIKTGCCHYVEDGTPNKIGTYKSLADAVAEMEKYSPSVDKYPRHYLVTEYYVEEAQYQTAEDADNDDIYSAGIVAWQNFDWTEEDGVTNVSTSAPFWEKEKLVPNVEDKLFNKLWLDALAQPNKEMYVGEYGYPDWFDHISEDANKVVKVLEQIHFVAHASMREIVKASNLTQAAFSTKFCIPLRTVEDWVAGRRNCPDYVRLMIAENLGIIDRK